MKDNPSCRPRKHRRATVSVLILTWLTTGMRLSLSAPIVQQVVGKLDHGATITVSGNGFESKITAAPLVWDDATGKNILDKWDGAWPYLLPGYNTAYYEPIHGIGPPHSHVRRYIAGAHAGSANAYAGYDVIFFKNIRLRPFPFYIYASWYQRADKNWAFGDDNNYKTFAYSNCCSPYEMPNNWFTCYGPPHPGSISDGAQWVYTDDGNSLQLPDTNGHNAWWGAGVNPMSGWSKVEVAVKVTNQTDGYIKVWENGRQVMDYAGSTDRYPGDRRTIGIGGYARMQTPRNWRYFADAYLDLTLSRIVLANRRELVQATIIENQIPSKWSDTSITAKVNLGRFENGEPAYLFVVNSAGVANKIGLPVATGDGVPPGTTSVAPHAPSDVVVH